MSRPQDARLLPSPSCALLRLARLNVGLTQRELAERAGEPVTMISGLEPDGDASVTRFRKALEPYAEVLSGDRMTPAAAEGVL